MTQVQPTIPPTTAGEKTTTSTHNYVAVDRGGVLVWKVDVDSASVIVSRKEGADDNGTGGSTTIDFGLGFYDNKHYGATGDLTVTLHPGSSPRGGDYLLFGRSTTSTKRQVTWAFGGGSSLATGRYLPTFFPDTDPLEIELQYDDLANEWHPEPVFDRQITAVAGVDITGTTWTPDCGNGVYLDWHITGVTGSAGFPVELQIPSNLPLGETMLITFQSQQTHGFNVDSAFAKLGTRPDYDAKTMLGIHRNTDGYQIRGLDVESWTTF